MCNVFLRGCFTSGPHRIPEFQKFQWVWGGGVKIVWVWSGSKLFDTMMVFLKEVLEKS